MNNHVEIQRHEVTLKKLFFMEVLKLVIGIVVSFCSFLFISSKISIDFIQSIAFPIRFLLFIILTIIGFATIFKGVYSITSIFMLKISDSHIFESKSLFKICKNFMISNKTSGTLYQQCNGNIFRLGAPVCNLCETPSKSAMHFTYEKKEKCYYLVCNKDKNHKIPIDTTNNKKAK